MVAVVSESFSDACRRALSEAESVQDFTRPDPEPAQALEMIAKFLRCEAKATEVDAALERVKGLLSRLPRRDRLANERRTLAVHVIAQACVTALSASVRSAVLSADATEDAAAKAWEYKAQPDRVAA